MSNIAKVLIENIFILILCLLMAVCIAAILMKRQASMLKITRTSFGEREDKVNFVQITDLHIPLLPVSMKKICGVISDEKPSFIIITGDLCQRQYLSRLESFLYMLTNAARCPVYITLGNHDNSIFAGDRAYKSAYIANIEKISPLISVLENDYDIIKIGNREIMIAGLCDFRDDASYDCDQEDKDSFNKKSIYVNTLLDEWSNISRNRKATLIIASHNPDILLFVNKKRADLFVFGHTHGGQIWMPFNLEFLLLRKKDKLPHKGYVYGSYKFNDNDIYISCGVGCNMIPLRFRSNPEVCVHSV